MNKTRTAYAKKATVKTPSHKKENRKKIKIESSDCGQGVMSAGCHKLRALQKHQGIVKKPLAKKLETIEHWIKRRDYGELAKRGKV